MQANGSDVYADTAGSATQDKVVDTADTTWHYLDDNSKPAEGWNTNANFDDSSFPGALDAVVPGSLIDMVCRDGSIESDVLEDDYGEDGGRLFENAFVTLHSGSQSMLTVNRKGKLWRIPEKKLFGGQGETDADVAGSSGAAEARTAKT